ncbi:cytochrome c biogenesis protein CcsA [Vitiosangium sp. GDMCC 1.1324]|uniref:cytochrome c biogenesis protein CcsA n=1 Tax=Vitiosangium sp. (strain GDMCC 1.1324) TaxID=2138576 RepID=UPI000D3CCD59|nr:transcriptional regulator [Vitiosangium sp. GDMCC 1.1324]
MNTVLQVISAVAALASVGLGIRLGVKWAPPGSRYNATPVLVGMTGAALGLLAVGTYLALVWTPPEREMGDVYRIIYVHVPAMWMALIALTLNFGLCVAYLLHTSWKTDALAEATAEVGLLFGSYGLVLGSIWGKPTWGTYWDWDPRLTAMAIMLVTYVAYMALRRFVEDPEKRAVWSSVVGIISFVNLPIVWFSVKWWRSLHQVQSTPKTVDPDMALSLRVNAWAFLIILTLFLLHRYRIALATREAEVAMPDALPPDAPGSRDNRASEVA